MLVLHASHLIHRKGIDLTEAGKIAEHLGCAPGSPQHASCADLIVKLYNMFRATDATLVEINPLAETPDGRVRVFAFM
jgi:succinyl-CoA synthetase beta subunit